MSCGYWRVALLDSIASRFATKSGPPRASVTADEHARLGGYYLRQNHELIQRHVESVELSLDHTAHWKLQISLELPADQEAHCDRDGNRCLFLFPLVYMGKSDGRLGFTLSDESGDATPVPTRQECDWISGLATAQAGNELVAQVGEGSEFPPEELTPILRGLAAASPFAAARIFDRLRRGLELEGRSRPRDTKAQPAGDVELDSLNIGDAWERTGFASVLRLMVEHSLIWIPIWGAPGERRVFRVSQDISLERRPFLRWSFGELQRGDAKSVLKLGDKLFGRRTYRISFSALGERIGQPLAWMPIEYDFPTVHTHRCSSYHFELTCPTGLSPRALKVATGDPIDEANRRSQGKQAASTESDATEPPLGRTKLTPSIAHHYIGGSRFTGDLWFRVTVGVSPGAMPVLWWLAGALTAGLLWIFAAADPALEGSEKEIAAGVLLVVPALVAALGIGGESAPVTRLIGGARILLLITGLSAVVAAVVLIGAAPFGLQASWTVCAIATTIVTLPLATSWVLSNPLVWRQLKKLKSARAQYAALRAGIAFAVVPVIGLQFMGNAQIARAAIGAYLLAIVVAMTALANNRAAMGIGHSRRYVAVAMLTASVACAALACIELKGAVDEHNGLQTWAERVALAALFASPFVGLLLGRLTKKFSPGRDEIHVSPQVGRELVAKERVLELNELLDRSWQRDVQTDRAEKVSLEG